MNDDYFNAVNNEGEEVLCQKLLTFNANNKNFIIYTDFEFDSDDNMNILASIYHMENDNLVLEPITNKEEWALIDQKWEEYNNE